MRIWNGIHRLSGAPRRAAASIGNYDGVHLGHQEILRRVVEAARERGEASLLVTFDPHPVAVVAPQRRPRLLQTRRQKLDCLEHVGLSDLLILDFTKAMASLSGDAFFQRILLPRFSFSSIHVGENFRFGRDRGGNLESLQRIGSAAGFEVDVVPAVRAGEETVSSTSIRQALTAGRVEQAHAMLGRPFAVTGEVVPGDGRGAEIRFPTANLVVENEMVPAVGVYVTETVALASRYPSVTNVGMRPTFRGTEVRVETHLIEFDGDLYTERIEVRFLAKLRDEIRFANAVELGDQIARDRAAAESYFANMQLRFD